MTLLTEVAPDHVTSFDGTVLASYRTGAEDGPPLVLANGIGVQLGAWSEALKELAERRPIVTWDYRGLHGSSAANSQRIDAGAHAEDLMAVADRYGFDAFDLIGWSTGGRIAAEAAIRYPERVRRLALVCGGKGHGLRRLLRAELSSLLPAAAGILKHFTGFLEAPFRKVTTRPELAGLVRQSGLIGPTADIHSLVDVLKGIAECDGKTWLAIYESVAGDGDPPRLDRIESPTLVIGGERDPFTSPGLLKEIAASISGAESVFYERATHYLPIEFPARLGSDLEKFLREADAFDASRSSDLQAESVAEDLERGGGLA